MITSTLKRFRPVRLDRLVVCLVRPLLALLLVAGLAQAVPSPRDDGDRARAVESAPKAASLSVDRTAPEPLPATTVPDRADDLDGSGPLLPAAAAGIVPDLARAIRIGRAAYPTAPPSHRPCAAPPTGPPLA
jgi:hypothetical protein